MAPLPRFRRRDAVVSVRRNLVLSDDDAATLAATDLANQLSGDKSNANNSLKTPLARVEGRVLERSRERLEAEELDLVAPSWVHREEDQLDIRLVVEVEPWFGVQPYEVVLASTRSEQEEAASDDQRAHEGTDRDGTAQDRSCSAHAR